MTRHVTPSFRNGEHASVPVLIVVEGYTAWQAVTHGRGWLVQRTRPDGVIEIVAMYPVNDDFPASHQMAQMFAEREASRLNQVQSLMIDPQRR